MLFFFNRKFHGHSSLKEYYEKESCVHFIHNVSVFKHTCFFFCIPPFWTRLNCQPCILRWMCHCCWWTPRMILSFMTHCSTSLAHSQVTRQSHSDSSRPGFRNACSLLLRLDKYSKGCKLAPRPTRTRCGRAFTVQSLYVYLWPSHYCFRKAFASVRGSELLTGTRNVSCSFSSKCHSLILARAEWTWIGHSEV